MRSAVLLVVLAASPCTPLGSIQTCKDVARDHPPLNLPMLGMRWAEAKGCLECKGDACLGCYNASSSTCARCVYDMDTCKKAIGDTECKRLRYGADMRGQTECRGSSFPFDLYNFGLCPGNDIKELNERENMSIEEARTACANYRDQSQVATNSSGFCMAFEYIPHPESVNVDLPLSCPDEPPVGGIRWVHAPGCVNCTGDKCLGCRHDASSDCARCVYDYDLCIKQPWNKTECDKLMYGASLRNDGETGCTKPGPGPPDGSYKITFKNAWHPDDGTPCPKHGVSFEHARTSNYNSWRLSYDPLRHHSGKDSSSDKGEIVKDVNDLDDIWLKQCVNKSECAVVSYCGNDARAGLPPNSAVDVTIEKSLQYKFNSGCLAYKLFNYKPPLEAEIVV